VAQGEVVPGCAGNTGQSTHQRRTVRLSQFSHVRINAAG